MERPTRESLAKLTTTVKPPNAPTEGGPPPSRDLVERLLGLALPNDLYDLQAVYGSGAFETAGSSTVLTLLNPFSRTYFRDLNQHRKILLDLLAAEGKEYLPFDFFPNRPGLLPCGSGEEQRLLFWYTKGSHDTWPLILLTPEQKFVTFNCSICGFLADLFMGELDQFGGSWNRRWFRDNMNEFRFMTSPSVGTEDFPPLHQAASAGWTDEVERLLQVGSDPNLADYEGRTTLFHAVERGSVASIRLLLRAGANPNALDASNVSPLHDAARMVIDVEAVRLLLEKGASVDLADEYGCTPLMRAVMYDNQPAVELLISNGADVNARASNGDSPISFAGDKAAIRKALLAAGAK